jgi:hypothetical protein
MVVTALLLAGGGATAVSDNAPLIAAVIALGGVFTAQMVSIALDERRAQEARHIEEEQWKHEIDINDRRAQDDALQAYLDQMGKLLLDKDKPLRQSKEGDEVRTLARAQTLTVLERLDGAHQVIVLRFLYESRLVDKGHVIVPLRDANLLDGALHYLNAVDFEELADSLEGVYMPDGYQFDKDYFKNKWKRDEEAEKRELQREDAEND